MTTKVSKDLIISTLTGSADVGGWVFSGSFANNQADAIYGRRVDVYFQAEGGGSWENSKRLAIQGNILPQSMSFTKRESGTTIQIATSHCYLVNAGHQGIYFTNTEASPTNPHNIPGLRLGNIVKHLVEGHTNCSIYTAGGWVDTSGIDTFTSTTVEVYTVKQSTSMWNTIANIAANEFYVRYFTKKDQLIYEMHPQFKTSLPTPVMTIDSTNMVETPEITYRSDVKVDQAYLYALTDTGAILTAYYPVDTGTEVRKQKYTNIRCNTQARLNVLAERAYKYLNRNINFRVTLAGAWGCYLELYDRVQVTYTGTTRNGVSIAWTQKKFYITSITVTRQGNFIATTELVLEEEIL